MSLGPGFRPTELQPEFQRSLCAAHCQRHPLYFAQHSAASFTGEQTPAAYERRVHHTGSAVEPTASPSQSAAVNVLPNRNSKEPS